MSNRGFTLLEIVIALAVVGLVMAVSVPAGARFYESMQYRAAVRDVVTVLSSARHKAMRDGQAIDVRINPRSNEVSLDDSVKRLPAALGITVSSAAELNARDTAVIRFYPEGGSSGGEVSLALPGRAGVRIVVDWLIGGISQESYAFN
jgi:general secretion pathway protein H